MENIQRKSQYEATESVFDLTIIKQSLRRLITHSEIDVISDQSSDILGTVLEIFDMYFKKYMGEFVFSTF